MLYHIPKLINRWSVHHANYLWFISGTSLASFAGSVIYAVLPVVIAVTHGEWYAGVLISAFGLFQAFFIDPVAGNLSDRIGSRKILMMGFLLGILAGVVWLVVPLQNIFALLLFSLLIFTSYGLRGTSETYILKTSKKDEGGMLFGIFGNTSSLAVFLATATLPFYVIAGREMLAAWTLIVIYGLSFVILYFLPNDQVLVKGKNQGLWSSLNPLPAVRQGLHFVKANGNYPILTLGATFFEGIFYGTVWFIFPLHMAKVGLAGAQSGLHLGVYDLVTALFAGYAGFLADKYNWRHTHSLGWFFVIVGLIALPFYGWPTWLVIVGFVIAIGNNLSYYAAAHALEANDIDHREDGSFVGLKSVASSLGYAISPLIAGFLYSQYGFAVSLSVNSALCVIIAIAMIWFTWRLENLPVKKKKTKRIRNKQVIAVQPV